MQYRIWSIFCLFCLAMAEAVGKEIRNEAVGKDIRNERRRRNYQKLKRINEEKALQEIKKRRLKKNGPVLPALAVNLPATVLEWLNQWLTLRKYDLNLVIS